MSIRTGGLNHRVECSNLKSDNICTHSEFVLFIFKNFNTPFCFVPGTLTNQPAVQLTVFIFLIKFQPQKTELYKVFFILLCISDDTINKIEVLHLQF